MSRLTLGIADIKYLNAMIEKVRYHTVWMENITFVKIDFSAQWFLVSRELSGDTKYLKFHDMDKLEVRKDYNKISKK